MKVLILNGPNLNLLGQREPEIYGETTLNDIAAACSTKGQALAFNVDFRQSNSEGELIDWIQAAIDSVEVIIINAAAYTHTSVAIHDALKAFPGFKVELHISNPHLRESFRHQSLLTPAVDAVVAGMGSAAYCDVLDVLQPAIDARAIGVDC